MKYLGWLLQKQKTAWFVGGDPPHCKSLCTSGARGFGCVGPVLLRGFLKTFGDTTPFKTQTHKE